LNVLLDLDGTLADSRPGILACFRYMLTELGHDPAAAGDLTWAVGPPMAVSVGTMLKMFDDDRVALGLTTYRARYTTTGIYECAAFPGIMEMLASLVQAGHNLCLATSKRRDFAERVVEYLGFGRFIPKVYGALPEGGLDEKKDLLAAILRAEGYERAVTTMVGDRYHDIHAARSNDLRSIGVLWGYGGEAELTEAGADSLAATPADLMNFI
jgi:phosphoglycolate phosphatase